MKKETFYFSHDYSCTNDPKIQALIGEFGASGYGIFWRIVELLHEDQEHRLYLKKYVYMAISSQLKESLDYIKKVIDYSVHTCELFEQKDNYIYSQRVMDNIEKREEIRLLRSKAGKRSAQVRAQHKVTHFEQKVTHVEQKVTKESKGKKSKVNNISYNDLLKYFNDVFLKNNRVFNDTMKNKYRTRINEGYTIENIRTAMFKASTDQFHKDNSYKYCTLEYFSRSTTIDKFGFNATKKAKYIPTK